jgi:DNA-directed RNA polymerase subunit alpha
MEQKICWLCGGVIHKAAVEKLETAIEKLDLSTRAFNCLKRNGIETVEQLLKLEHRKLLNLRNVGEKTAQEIAKKIDELGFGKIN